MEGDDTKYTVGISAGFPWVLFLLGDLGDCCAGQTFRWQKCHDISSVVARYIQESHPTAKVAVLGPNVSGRLNSSHVELSDGKINFTGMFVLRLAQHRDALVGLGERRSLEPVTVRVRERATVLSGRKLTAHHHVRNVYRPNWGPQRFRSYPCRKKNGSAVRVSAWCARVALRQLRLDSRLKAKKRVYW